MPKCDYCNEEIWHSARWAQTDLPDDLPWSDSWDEMVYHPYCFESVVDEARSEIAAKHGAG